MRSSRARLTPESALHPPDLLEELRGDELEGLHALLAAAQHDGPFARGWGIAGTAFGKAELAALAAKAAASRG